MKKETQKIKNLTKDQARKEYTLDATGESLGRVATKVAMLLQGKTTADYYPNKLGNVFVTVNNLKDAKFTGKKLTDKIYVRWTGYIGNNKQINLRDKFKKDMVKTFKDIVRGMLPKNTLRDKRLKNLIVK